MGGCGWAFASPWKKAIPPRPPLKVTAEEIKMNRCMLTNLVCFSISVLTVNSLRECHRQLQWKHAARSSCFQDTGAERSDLPHSENCELPPLFKCARTSESKTKALALALQSSPSKACTTPREGKSLKLHSVGTRANQVRDPFKASCLI